MLSKYGIDPSSIGAIAGAVLLLGIAMMLTGLRRKGTKATEGGTVPDEDTPDDVARTQHRLRILQWAYPVLTGALVVLGAQQGGHSCHHRLGRPSVIG
jgi:hypothetical protein